MAHQTQTSSGSDQLRTVWDSEFGLDPVEEPKIADWVETPVGQKFGNSMKLRKLPAIAAQSYTPSATNSLRGALTWATNTSATVTATAVARYSAVGLERTLVNQVIDDGPLRNGYKKMLTASLDEAVDTLLFALGNSLSSTVSQADVDDAMVRTALGQLAANAKGKFREDSAKLLVVHPSELKNVWNIPAIKEYQIRGRIGSAVDLKMNAYGLMWRESGLVLNSLGSYYNPLLLKDAWALAWNEKPHILDVQVDGLSENFIAYTELGVCEWFDTSGVALITT